MERRESCRWRALHRCRILAEHLAANLESTHDDTPMLSFCFAHPSTYLGAVLGVSAAHADTGVFQRLPSAAVTDAAADDRGGRRPPRSLHVVADVRVEELGVRLNKSRVLEPAAAATAHLLLLRRMCGSAGLPLRVDVTCAATESSVRLLLAWERQCGGEEALGFTVGDLRVRGGGVLRGCLRANEGCPARRLLSTAASLLVTASPDTVGDAALEGLEAMTNLRTLRVVGVPLRSISGVAELAFLRSVWLDAAAINDEDVRVLASLAALEELTLLECPRVTSLDVLGALPCLRSVTAECCGGLLHVGGLAKAPRLRRLSLCWNVSVDGEEMEQVFAATTQPLRDLCLVGQRLPLRPPPPTLRGRLAPALHSLNLNEATIRGASSWIARMPHLQQLYLARSTVTDEDLTRMFTAVESNGPAEAPQLVLLMLDNCPRLRTSLAFAEALPSLTMLSISADSLTPDNRVAELRARGREVGVR